MGSPAQLSLDYRPPPAHSNPILGASCFDGMMCGQIRKAEEYLAGLVEERRKIEAFKRELPLCMQLINEAIEAYQDRLAVPWPQFQPLPPRKDEDCSEEDSHDYHVSDKTHPLEEFTPPVRNTQDFLGAEDREIRKMNSETKTESIDWMSAAKARIVVCPDIAEPESSTVLHFQQEAETVAKPFFHSKHRSGGAFSPFQRDKQAPQPTPTSSFPDLTLSSGEQTAEVASKCKGLTVVASVAIAQSIKEDLEDDQECKELVVSTKGSGSASSGGSSGSQPQQRKPRRCWSPELHRRFINALQQLGGSQVATPKQIRELMKVDGLTNDEVKSHLQKYRLHTKKPGSVSAQTGTAVQTTQMVVLGGVWVPPDFAATMAQHSTPALFSGQQQSHICQPPMSQDLYSSSTHNASPNPLHPSSSAFYNQQQSAVVQPHGPPQRTAASVDVKGRHGNRSEEGNSQSSKWKGHIHENYRLQQESRGRRHREVVNSDAEDNSDDSHTSQRS